MNMETEISLPEFEGFDWSGGNAGKIWQTHHVTPLEAEQAFFNSPLFCSPDTAHSHDEIRYYILGQTDNRRKLFIAFTTRKKLIRVISARDMSRKERRGYKP
jgi:uncharacterized protein